MAIKGDTNHGNSNSNDYRFQKQARKDYRHEDSMMMYDSNVNTVQA